MAASKTRTSIQSAQSSSHTDIGPDLSAAYGAQLDLSIANGTGTYTTGGQYQVQVAADYNSGSPHLWVNYGGPLVAGLTASTTYSWSVPIPIGVAAVQVIFTVGTGSASPSWTGNADISTVTGI